MINYWENKEQATAHAKSVAAYIAKHYAAETADSVNRTVCFYEMQTVPPVLPRVPETEILVEQETTVDAIFKYAGADEYVCALNFASYKEPGGMFLAGSTAQEESLCHEGNLYNILSADRLRSLFYLPHKKTLNRALYHSDMLYTPDVLFIRKDTVVKCSVITCAAPNKRTAQRCQNVSDEEVSAVMRHRIDSILYNAAIMEEEVLILGAFGCGVFGNDLQEVSETFRDLLEDKYCGRFRMVVFAVPDQGSFVTMKSVLEK